MKNLLRDAMKQKYYLENSIKCIIQNIIIATNYKLKVKGTNLLNFHSQKSFIVNSIKI